MPNGNAQMGDVESVGRSDDADDVAIVYGLAHGLAVNDLIGRYIAELTACEILLLFLDGRQQLRMTAEGDIGLRMARHIVDLHRLDGCERRIWLLHFAGIAQATVVAYPVAEVVDAAGRPSNAAGGAV